MRRVVDSLDSGVLAPDEPGVFRPIRETLLGDNEHYFHLADLVAYRDRSSTPPRSGPIGVPGHAKRCSPSPA